MSFLDGLLIDLKCQNAEPRKPEEIDDPETIISPERLIVPQLFAWKSAKWIKGVRFIEHDQAGYWEERRWLSHARQSLDIRRR